MDFKQIQSIIKDFEKSNLKSLELEMEDLKIKLNKDPFRSEEVVVTKASKSFVPKEEITEERSGIDVKSPLVGTFYAASSPTDEPFAKVGQAVEKGQTICIIEAMKIMNEITAPVSGVIEAIHVENGQAIGFDEAIMTIY